MAVQQANRSEALYQLNLNGTPVNAPVQIKRNNKIAANPALNAYYQKLLAGSVFAHYRRVSTQWQTGGAPQGTPANVANIVIETYVQDATAKAGVASALPASFFPPAKPGLPRLRPDARERLPRLHLNATAANGATLTDHSFLFLEAK